MENLLLHNIFERKLIAIIRGIGSDRMLDTVGALVDGGISLLEVTLDQRDEAKENDGIRSMERIKESFGDRVSLGAGTVITVDQVKRVVAAGAEFIISPNVSPEVIQETKHLGKISIPGAFTPSEMVLAHECGADVVKLFPAGLLGIDYIKAVLAPLNHIPVFAVGGVTLTNIKEFIKSGVKGVGIGGNLVDKQAILSGDYAKIRDTAWLYVNALKE